MIAVKKLLGYCEPWSVKPGARVSLHASSERGEAYELDLVRVVASGGAGNGAVVPVEHPQAGRYPGEERPLPAGSYGEAMAPADWDPATGFELSLHVFATLPLRGRPQALFSHRDREGRGFWLGLDYAGRLTWSWGGAAAPTTLTAPTPLREQRWYEVRAAWRSADEIGTLSADGRDVWPDPPVDRAGQGRFAAPAPGTTLRVAAAHGVDGAPAEHFNGRIEDPTIRAGAETLAEWDFSRELGDFRGVDRGPRAIDLTLHNAPTRAVPGRLWDGTVHNPANGAEHYGAVHFHEDDLEDACWPADVILEVPEGLASGIYGFRLRVPGDEAIVPFFVAPADDGEVAPVAFLASTATYLAYANNRLRTQSPIYELSETFGTAAIDRLEATLTQRQDLGPSLYDHHRDGHVAQIASRRRPLVDITAGGGHWTLNADLDIVAHLERTLDRYDVVADEDLHRDGLSAIARHRCIVTGTHPEYWSTAMWDAMVEFLAGGGRLMYLGGNGFYWRVSHHPERPWLMECRRAEIGARYSEAPPGEYHHQFGGELGGLWRRVGRPPQGLVGVGMAGDGWDVGSPYYFQSDAHDPRAAFIVDGLDLDRPLGEHGVFGAAGGAEIDRADEALGTPRHALVLASSGPHSVNFVVAPEETLFLHRGNTGDVNPELRADIVFFETQSGGAVFSTGSIAWGGSLPTNDFDNDVARMTANVVRRFADPEPFRAPAPTESSEAGPLSQQS